MANAWIEQIFDADQVARGNAVRRAKTDIEKNASMAELEAEVRRRGFHMVQVGEQIVVICNTGTISVIC